MDLFEIPILKPEDNSGDSFVDEPSSVSNHGINSSDSYYSQINDSLEYIESTGRNCEVNETEESNQDLYEIKLNYSSDSDVGQCETSKFITYSQYTDKPSKSINFIEYTEYNIRKVDKSHSLDDTIYEIATNSIQAKEKLVRVPKTRQTSKSPIKIIDSANQTCVEEQDWRPVSHSPIQKTPEMMKTNPRSLILDLKNINKSVRTSIERKELNITAPLVILPEPRKSYKESFRDQYQHSYRETYKDFTQSLRRSLDAPLSSTRYRIDLDILHSDQMTARKRLNFIEVELERAQQKMKYLSNQLLENEKSNFIERSQRLSEINYSKIKLEVLDIKNGNLEKDNERLRLLLEDMKGAKKGIVTDPQDYGERLNSKDRYLNERTEEPKTKIDLTREFKTLSQSKESIERELRKLGITSQRSEILRNKLQETNEKLKELKSHSPFLYN